MKLAAWAQSHARSILFSLFVLVAAGVFSSLNLPVALFPQISFPRIRVNVDAGERPAERMGIEVSFPLEEALRSVPGVRSVRSTTSRGSAEVDVSFDWGADMTSALLQAESQVNRVMPSLPPGTTFEIRRMDPTVFPVIAYSITSDAHSLTELRDLAQYTLRPSLTTITGVAKVDVQGGAIEEFRVVVDPIKLAALGMSLADVSTALSASNVLTGVGQLEQDNKQYLIVSDTRLTDAAQIGATVLKSGAGGIVRLDQVATVRTDVMPRFTSVAADGQDAVLFQVYQQPSGNTVQIARDVRSKLDELHKSIPPGVKLRSWYDQSDLINGSAHSVRDAVLIGVLLAAFVLLAFLRNWKVTLIATLAVPAVLAATVVVLYALHMSFNIMTLGGMAAAVGLIIDDTIVMVEHIIRRLAGATTGEQQQRIVRATGEFTKPLVGSSLSTIVIHIPPAFISGVAGEFFKALSLTMAAGLVISLLVAWLVIPVLAMRLLGPKDVEREERVGAPGMLQHGYAAIMRLVLARPWMILLIIVPLAAGGYLAFGHMEQGFMPSMDEGGFIIDYRMPPGTSLSETNRTLRRLETMLRETPEVLTYSRRTGLGLGGDIQEPGTGDFFVRLKPMPRRDIDEVMSELRAQVTKTLPGLDIETPQLMEDLIGDLTAVPQPIEIKLYSEEQATLNTLGPKVAEAIGKVRGVVEVQNGIIPAGDAISIEVDRVKAALEGVDPDAVTKSLNDALSGTVTTQIGRGPKLVGVRVWIPRRLRLTQEDVASLPLRVGNGHVFPLGRIATLTIVTGQPEVHREDLRRMAAVTARIENRDLGSSVAELKTVLEQAGLIPPGVQYEIGGLYQQQQIAFRSLVTVIIAGVVLVFLLLLFLYESFLIPIAILINTTLAMAAVFLGLWLTHTELNITSLMGMVMIVGNVTEVAIFYYSEYSEIPAAGSSSARLIRAGQNRIRAILMTTLAAILALLPLALGIGEGSELLKPLAIAIISGLAVQLPLTLGVLPAMLSFVGNVRRRS